MDPVRALGFRKGCLTVSVVSPIHAVKIFYGEKIRLSLHDFELRAGFREPSTCSLFVRDIFYGALN
jgi:hypothetical protein